MMTWYLLKTWPYKNLVDFRGYRFNEVILKVIIWPFAVFFFGLTFAALLTIMLINVILRTWVVYPKALSSVSSHVFTPRAASLFGWVGKLLSLIIIVFYGALIFIEKIVRRFPLGVLRFLNLKES